MALSMRNPVFVAEPTPAVLSNPLARFFLATRPAFLSVTLFGCLIGLATAYYSGIPIAPASAVGTLVFALIAHAGINVLNDYFDSRSGADAINTDRIFPYTGGSRFIQNGVLTEAETAVFGVVLMGLAILGGLWLTRVSGAGLVAIGAAGLFIGWAYSAPPLKLNSQGVGEACVAIGFSLISVGTDYVQRKGFCVLPLAASACYALLVTNLLYINQFPDRRADEAVGKRHCVVRLGARKARWGYVLIAAAAYGWAAGATLSGLLPRIALISLAPAVLTFSAARDLLRHAEQPKQLAPAIRLTIAAASLHGLLVALALLLARTAG
jgi:1,4-dihydroxy-2-naphthoate polyprenyltransferase